MGRAPPLYELKLAPLGTTAITEDNVCGWQFLNQFRCFDFSAGSSALAASPLVNKFPKTSRQVIYEVFELSWNSIRKLETGLAFSTAHFKSVAISKNRLWSSHPVQLCASVTFHKTRVSRYLLRVTLRIWDCAGARNGGFACGAVELGAELVFG